MDKAALRAYSHGAIAILLEMGNMVFYGTIHI